MSHLDQAKYFALSSPATDPEQRAFWEEHLDSCEECQARAEEWEEEAAAGLPAVELSDAATDALLRIFVQRAPLRAELKESPNRVLKALASAPTGVLEIDLLRLLGTTVSLEECALKHRMAPRNLESACRQLAADVRERHAELLAEAESLARQLSGPAFDEFVRSGAAVAHAAGKQTVDDGASAVPLRLAAASASQQRQYPCVEDPNYGLLVEKVEEEGGRSTIIRCLGPGKRRRWRYRLWFENDDEGRTLDERGLTPVHRGVLRVAHALGKSRWAEFLDLVLPLRAGSSRDGADPIKLAGWPRGFPTRGRLWLLE